MPKKQLQPRKLKPVERKVSTDDKATISSVKAFTPKERREAAAVVAAAEGLAKKYAAASSNSVHQNSRTA